MVKIINCAQLSKRKVYQIKTTLHEGAVAIAGETTFQDKSFDTCQTIIHEAFVSFNEWIADCGGIVGHLKCFISSLDQKEMISTTGDQVICRIQPSEKVGEVERKDEVQISIALIVFNIHQNDLEARLIGLFDRLEK